jgi:hypothetical protein
VAGDNGKEVAGVQGDVPKSTLSSTGMMWLAAVSPARRGMDLTRDGDDAAVVTSPGRVPILMLICASPWINR